MATQLKAFNLEDFLTLKSFRKDNLLTLNSGTVKASPSIAKHYFTSLMSAYSYMQVEEILKEIAFKKIDVNSIVMNIPKALLKSIGSQSIIKTHDTFLNRYFSEFFRPLKLSDTTLTHLIAHSEVKTNLSLYAYLNQVASVSYKGIIINKENLSALLDNTEFDMEQIKSSVKKLVSHYAINYDNSILSLYFRGMCRQKKGFHEKFFNQNQLKFIIDKTDVNVKSMYNFSVLESMKDSMEPSIISDKNLELIASKIKVTTQVERQKLASTAVYFFYSESDKAIKFLDLIDKHQKTNWLNLVLSDTRKLSNINRFLPHVSLINLKALVIDKKMPLPKERIEIIKARAGGQEILLERQALKEKASLQKALKPSPHITPTSVSKL